MSRKSKNKSHVSSFKLELSSQAQKEIAGLVLIIFSLIFFFSFFHSAGRVGGILQNVFIKSIGWGYFLIPFILLAAGISLIFRHSERKFILSSSLGIILFIFSILGFFQIVLPGYQTAESGGYIGQLIAHPLIFLFGKYVATIIFLIGIIISLIFVFDTSIQQTFSFFVSLKNKFKKQPLPEKELLTSQENNSAEKVSTNLDKKTKNNDSIKINNLNLTPHKTISKKNETDQNIKVENIDQTNFKLPPLKLLGQETGKPAGGNLKASANIIKQTFHNFGIEVEMAEINIGPTVTQYTLRPAQGVKLTQITSLQNDLSLALAAHPLRIEAPIPGRSLVGIEVPNKSIINVKLRNLLESSAIKSQKGSLMLALGRDVAGNPVFTDLSRMPHLLIAGATGTGKSVCLNSIIISLIYQYTPNYLRLILLDPKRVEFPIYRDIPHLLTPPVVNVDKMFNTLKWSVSEMEERFKILAENNCRDIQQYHRLIVKQKEVENKMPYIILIIDELADLMMAHGRDVEATIVRLSQMARAVGIHLILATQRPSVKVITGLIKANITARISFKVASQIDSRTILDSSGAEKLLGRGDMLFISPTTPKPKRIQGCLVTTEEVKKVTDFLKSQSKPDYQEEIIEYEKPSLPGQISRYGNEDTDELYEEAKKVVIEEQRGSTSSLQRRLRIGYGRAARLLDMLEKNGVVGQANGTKPRKVLIKEEETQGGWE